MSDISAVSLTCSVLLVSHLASLNKVHQIKVFGTQTSAHYPAEAVRGPDVGLGAAASTGAALYSL